MSEIEPLKLSLIEAAALIRDKKLSPVELTDACLRKIAEVNPQLHAYITVFEEEARQVAKASEMMLMAGHLLGPLHGVPIALKDNIAMKGHRTTAGSKILADWFPDADAAVAARLKSAGAIILGKNNLHEFAWGATSDNPHYGTVKNPLDVSRTPMGSSGGSAAAVASGTCFGALGTDTGGSIRLPASVMGLVGIRPTIGRVSNSGVIPLAWSMDTVGPLTRKLEDCAAMLQVIAGYDHNDEGTAAVPVPDYSKASGLGIKGLRIGIIPDFTFHAVDPQVETAVKAALRKMEQMGASVFEIPIEHKEDQLAAQLIVEACEPSTYHQQWLRQRPGDYGDDVRLLLELGELHFASQYLQAQRYRNVLRKEMNDAFKHVDVFVSPTIPFTVNKVRSDAASVEDSVEEDLTLSMKFTNIPSLTGLPAINIPCGFDADGLPIGMQIIGKPFDEETLFRVGSAFQGNI